jgi:hypothetical protein
MKLSNKILLGFFGFIFLYLTAVFAEIRWSGTSNTIDDSNSIAETVDLSGISYLIVTNLEKEVSVIGSDRPRLELRSSSGNWLAKLKYKVSGDTLMLSGLQSEETRTLRISVFVPKTSFKGITVNENMVIVEALQQDFLQLSQNAGRVWMSGSIIGRIQMDLSNKAYLDISGTKLDTLSAEIEGSEVRMSSPVGLVQGSLKNKAFLQVSHIQEIQLKKDESSRLNIYQ